MTNSALCKRVQNSLAQDLGRELGPELQQHCESCPSCRGELAQVRALAASLTRLQERTAESALAIDLSARLLTRLDDTVAVPALWPRRMAFAAAFAVLLFTLWQWRGSSGSPAVASIDAPTGARLQHAGRHSEIRGTEIAQALGFSLSTDASQAAIVRLPRTRLRLAASTRVELAKADRLELITGSIGLETETKFNITAAGAPASRIQVMGRAAIEHQTKGTPMQILKRHKVVTSSALVAVALYAGWTTIRSEAGTTTRLNAPTGVYLDAEGKPHAFDLKGTQSPEELLALGLARAADGTSDPAQDDPGFASSGAFWSDKDQVVQFRIRGEAFDADIGVPLDGFELRAKRIESKDYGQRSSITRSFVDLQEGQFTLNGLGLGTWQITATREGYAPVIQTLEIADLRATPYLVIPLSSTGAQLSGRVIDWQGKPVAGASIGLAQCGNGEDKEPGCQLAKSDPSGNFVLDKLPEEEVYSLYAKHERYGFATTKNLRSSVEEDGAGQHITIRLSGVVRIYGRVMRGANDEALAGARVAGGGKEAVSGEDGNYEFLAPLEETPEAHIVSYPGSAKGLAIHSYPDSRSIRELTWVNAPTHAAQVRIDFHLEMSDASLVGRISDARGAPQADLEVQLMNTTGWKGNRGHETFPTLAVTDAGGNYRVDHIPAEAGYMLRYRPKGGEEWNDLGYVNITEETEVRADFQVGSAAIRGRFVKAESGEPMRVGEMSCSRIGAERADAPGVFLLAHCYPDGRFEITDLLPGTYALHSKVEWMDSTVKFKSKKVKLRPGQLLTDVAIEVEGEGAQMWRFRILSTENEFLPGAYIRYRVGNSNTTANLRVGDDGTASQQITESIKEIYLEVPGYGSEQVDLSRRDPKEVIEVHLNKIEESEPDAESETDAP